MVTQYWDMWLLLLFAGSVVTALIIRTTLAVFRWLTFLYRHVCGNHIV